MQLWDGLLGHVHGPTFPKDAVDSVPEASGKGMWLNSEGTGLAQLCRCPLTPPAASGRRFPFSRPELLKEWVLNIGRGNFQPKQHTVICSEHFRPECFSAFGNRKNLKHNAVPTEFAFRDARPVSARRSQPARHGRGWHGVGFQGHRRPRPLPGRHARRCLREGDRPRREAGAAGS